ncbi:sensor histidine kinase [Cohnella rhizosphaerae]|uniref:Sensor histidine kinase n=1 Tax=Cohnella rhizosphaerae TaxID=1457232 RepID=A0A9X4KRR6_9BACL|nr:hypothetical protein [Cohnella rhizosphaerae]MDG0809700.1 hypothetical protein [Cohnella rhizosphaerae]
MILQPVLENAFEHGLEDLEENGLLSVRFLPEKDGLLIEVANNGAPMTDETLRQFQFDIQSNEAAEVTGLINIHRRIRLLMGNESGLSVASGAFGVIVSIRLATI